LGLLATSSADCLHNAPKGLTREQQAQLCGDSTSTGPAVCSVRKELIDFSAVAMVELCKGAVDAEPAMCYGDMAKLDKTLATEFGIQLCTSSSSNGLCANEIKLLKSASRVQARSCGGSDDSGECEAATQTSKQAAAAAKSCTQESGMQPDSDQTGSKTVAELAVENKAAAERQAGIDQEAAAKASKEKHEAKKVADRQEWTELTEKRKAEAAAAKEQAALSKQAEAAEEAEAEAAHQAQAEEVEEEAEEEAAEEEEEAAAEEEEAAAEEEEAPAEEAETVAETVEL